MEGLPSFSPSGEVAGLQGEMTAMAKLCQKKAGPPAFKDNEDMANEHISHQRMSPENQREEGHCGKA